MALLPLILLACAPDPPDRSDALVASDHLFRASMAVRGVPPSREELAALRGAPADLEAIVRGLLEDPRFEDTVRDHHADAFQLRSHIVGKLPALGPLAGVPESQLDHSLDEAPLHLVADIVASGRPYTEIVTTDRTFVDALTAEVHGLPYDPSGPTWQATTWADGRPTAGLLSDTAILQRYQSSISNHHRGRAAVVLAELVCSGLLETTTELGIPPQIGEPDESIVRTDPACSGCHATLDPIASAFSGFDRYILAKDVTAAYQDDCVEEAHCYPLAFFDPTELDYWEQVGMPAPAWKGRAVEGLEGLGQAIAADPAFAECTARRFHGWHTGRDPADVPVEVAQELADVLVAADYDARELVVASVLHDDFVNSPRRPIRPGELARTVEALTGYRWKARLGMPTGTVDLATSAKHGFRTLLGGTDGWDTLDPARTPTPSQVMSVEALALEAGHHAVQRALERDASERTLFTVAAPGPMADATAREQLVELHEVILALDPDVDSPAIDDALALLRELEAQADDPTIAWGWMVAALLQHPRLVLP